MREWRRDEGGKALEERSYFRNPREGGAKEQDFDNLHEAIVEKPEGISKSNDPLEAINPREVRTWLLGVHFCTLPATSRYLSALGGRDFRLRFSSNSLSSCRP